MGRKPANSENERRFEVSLKLLRVTTYVQKTARKRLKGLNKCRFEHSQTNAHSRQEYWNIAKSNSKIFVLLT